MVHFDDLALTRGVKSVLVKHLTFASDYWVIDADVQFWEGYDLALVLVVGVPALFLIRVGSSVGHLVALRLRRDISWKNPATAHMSSCIRHTINGICIGRQL